jgi:hypothetical protein
VLLNLEAVVELLEYVNEAGVSPFARWREQLDPVARARVTVAVFRLEAGTADVAGIQADEKEDGGR